MTNSTTIFKAVLNRSVMATRILGQLAIGAVLLSGLDGAEARRNGGHDGGDYNYTISNDSGSERAHGVISVIIKPKTPGVPGPVAGGPGAPGTPTPTEPPPTKPAPVLIDPGYGASGTPAAGGGGHAPGQNGGTPIRQE